MAAMKLFEGATGATVVKDIQLREGEIESSKKDKKHLVLSGNVLVMGQKRVEVSSNAAAAASNVELEKKIAEIEGMIEAAQSLDEI